jgi:hypothetical protein
LAREILVWGALGHPNVVEFKGYVQEVAEYPGIVSKVRNILLLSVLFIIYVHVDSRKPQWCSKGNAVRYFEENPDTPLQKRLSLVNNSLISLIIKY